MTKTLLKFTSLLVLTVFAVSFLLVACSNEGISADEGLPKGFTKVSEVEINYDEIVEIRHNETGCHYILVNGTRATAITPMYIKHASSTPYCD